LVNDVARQFRELVLKAVNTGRNQMPIMHRQEEGTLRERLNQISKNLEGIRTGESNPDVLEYRRQGDRFSVMIRPSEQINVKG
jgi:hypothetical protein